MFRNIIIAVVLSLFNPAFAGEGSDAPVLSTEKREENVKHEVSNTFEIGGLKVRVSELEKEIEQMKLDLEKAKPRGGGSGHPDRKPLVDALEVRVKALEECLKPPAERSPGAKCPVVVVAQQGGNDVVQPDWDAIRGELDKLEDDVADLGPRVTKLEERADKSDERNDDQDGRITALENTEPTFLGMSGAEFRFRVLAEGSVEVLNPTLTGKPYHAFGLVGVEVGAANDRAGNSLILRIGEGSLRSYSLQAGFSHVRVIENFEVGGEIGVVWNAYRSVAEGNPFVLLPDWRQRFAGLHLGLVSAYKLSINSEESELRGVPQPVIGFRLGVRPGGGTVSELSAHNRGWLEDDEDPNLDTFMAPFSMSIFVGIEW